MNTLQKVPDSQYIIPEEWKMGNISFADFCAFGHNAKTRLFYYWQDQLLQSTNWSNRIRDRSMQNEVLKRQKNMVQFINNLTITFGRPIGYEETTAMPLFAFLRPHDWFQEEDEEKPVLFYSVGRKSFSVKRAFVLKHNNNNILLDKDTVEVSIYSPFLLKQWEYAWLKCNLDEINTWVKYSSLPDEIKADYVVALQK